MFCGHCGQFNPDANTACASCGKEVRVALNPAASAAAAPAPAVASEQRPMLSNLENYDAGLKGVGGWLLLFCIGTTILTPIILLREAMANANNITVVGLDLALTALALSTGIALWSHSRYALPLVRAYFIAQLVIAVLGILGSVAMNTAAEGPADTNAARSALFQGIRTFGVVALWWAYFKKSERVRGTYGRNL